MICACNERMALVKVGSMAGRRQPLSSPIGEGGIRQTSAVQIHTYQLQSIESPGKIVDSNTAVC